MWIQMLQALPLGKEEWVKVLLWSFFKIIGFKNKYLQQSNFSATDKYSKTEAEILQLLMGLNVIWDQKRPICLIFLICILLCYLLCFNFPEFLFLIGECFESECWEVSRSFKGARWILCNACFPAGETKGEEAAHESQCWCLEGAVPAALKPDLWARGLRAFQAACWSLLLSCKCSFHIQNCFSFGRTSMLDMALSSPFRSWCFQGIIYNNSQGKRMT